MLSNILKGKFYSFTVCGTYYSGRSIEEAGGKESVFVKKERKRRRENTRCDVNTSMAPTTRNPTGIH